MKKTNVLTQARYARLVKDARKLIEEGKQKAVEAANQQLASTYWKLGQRLTEEGLTENAGYQQAILAELSEELNIDVSTLKRSISFFQTYKSAPWGTFLSWSHYKILLPLQNKQKRQWYESLAQKKNLTRRQLSLAIKQGRFEEHQKSNGNTIEIKPLKRPVKGTYLYKAYVENVIDGDTLLLRIDLGFQVLKMQRVRLAGIDTPPIDEPKGRAAYRWVRDKLAKVEFVMVKTNKIDIYGRYIGHIFYSFNTRNKNTIFEEGRYLNQELLSKGLAVLM